MPKPVRSNIYTYQIGNTKSINRSYNFINARDGGQGPAFFWNNYWSSFRPGPVPPPVYNTKIVALLDYSYIVDSRNAATLQYYFDNYSTVFQPFPIVDTGVGIPNTLNSLQTYYDKGYRVFLLTALSTVIAGVLEWFNSHPDTMGISAYSQSSALAIPKRIYRLTPDNNLKFNLYANACILPYDYIYYIYDPAQLINQSVLINIQQITQSTGKTLVTFPIENPSTLTTEQINNIISQIPTGNNSSILVSMITYTNNFYNLFNNTTPVLGYPFYELFIYPNITNTESQVYFKDILYQVTGSQANLSTSYLWNVGYQHFGIENYSYNALNSMIMAYQIENDAYVNNLGAHSDNIIFNQFTRDVVDVNIGVSKFIQLDGVYKFVPISIYYKDAENIIYLAFVDIPSTSKDVQPIYKPLTNKIFKATNSLSRKPIALLELSGLNSYDTGLNKSLNYFWENNNDFVRFPVYDTGSTVDKTLELLQKYYDEGYRVFMACSRSGMLVQTINWFLEHPDAIGLSQQSNTLNLDYPKNVYRFKPSISFFTDCISQELHATVDRGGRIFYLFANDPTMLNARDILIATYGESNVLLFRTTPDYSNFTKENVTNFFYSNNINSLDSVVVLFYPKEQQEYVDFFDSTLDIPCNQYDIQGVSFPVMNPSTTTLTNKYYYTNIGNITTSKLWNDGQAYLENVYSTNCLNMLYFMTNYVKNVDVTNLYAYNSVLTFNENNDIKYGCIELYLYTGMTVPYEIFKIFLNDPLYNKITFYPI